MLHFTCEKAIEKLFKCILLLNKIKVKNINHDLNEALKLINRKCKYVTLSENTKLFIKTVNDMGSAGSRYFESPTHMTNKNLEQLDRAIFDIRRFSIWNSSKINMENITNPELTNFNDFKIENGYLEKVLSNNSLAIEALTWHNVALSEAPPPLSFEVKNIPANYLFKTDEEKLNFYREINQYCFIPIEIKKELDKEKKH